MVELAGGGGNRYPSASATGAADAVGSHILERRIVEWPWDRHGGRNGHVLHRVGNIGIDPRTERILRRHRIGVQPTDSSAAAERWLFPGRSIRSVPCAVPWKIAHWCSSVIAGNDYEDPGSAGKSFHYAPQFVAQTDEITIGYAPVDFDESAAPSRAQGSRKR